jgi:hypothetical protein
MSFRAGLITNAPPPTPPPKNNRGDLSVGVEEFTRCENRMSRRFRFARFFLAEIRNWSERIKGNLSKIGNMTISFFLGEANQNIFYLDFLSSCILIRNGSFEIDVNNLNASCL